MARRQTDYTLDQIRKMLKDGKSASGNRAAGTLCAALANGLPTGLIYNEIGLIFLAGGKEGKRAETDLLKMLRKDGQKEQDIAYFYLKTGSRTAVAGSKALKEIAVFEAAPQNAESVRFVGEKLADFTS